MSAAEQLNLSEVPAKPDSARRRRPHATVLILATLKATGVPMLAAEIARATHLPPSTVAARMGELLRKRLVLPSQYRGTVTGRGAWAFVLPASLEPGQRAACEEVAARLVARRGRYVPGPDDLDAARTEILGT